MASTTIRLNTGDHFPTVGLGMWKVPGADCASLIRDAVSAGYRHFDCACDYGNEQEIGDGLSSLFQTQAVAREELWITSKLWNNYHREEHVELACKKTLSDLQLDYLDLYLIHFPLAHKFVPIEERYPPGWFDDPSAEQPQIVLDRVPLSETWGAMEQLKAKGLVKNIGICNYGTAMLRDLLNYANDPPAVLQVESHPYLVQQKLLRFCQEAGIAFTAFSPLAALAYHELGMAEETDSLLVNSTIQDIAADHQKTPAQVLLRWGVQRGTAVIPKTTKAERLAENIALFDFELTEQQMQTISGFDQHRRYNDPGVFGEAAFNTFCPIYD